MDDSKVSLLDRYAALVFDANQRFNLTGFKTQALIRSELIGRTLASVEAIDFAAWGVASAIDLGSGAGCPGIVIAIARPATEVTMVEANQKKAKFIAEAIGRLGLTNAKVLCARMERMDPRLCEERFDLGVSRAVGSIALVNELLAPWIKTGGRVCHAKSVGCDEELARALPFAPDLGLRLSAKTPVPGDPARDVNIIFRKIAETKLEYPRNWKAIKKRHG